jgi:hypothetical protein
MIFFREKITFYHKRLIGMVSLSEILGAAEAMVPCNKSIHRSHDT